MEESKAKNVTKGEKVHNFLAPPPSNNLDFFEFGKNWKQAEADVVPSSSSVQFKLESDLVFVKFILD